MKFGVKGFFWKSVEKFQVWLKSEKNKGLFTWGPAYICDKISLNLRMRHVLDNCRKDQNTYCTFSNFFSEDRAVYEIKLNVEKYGRARQDTDDTIIRCIKDSICKNTDKHSFSTVNSRAKCFVAQQQCKGNSLLHFHVNTEHFCIVDNYIYVNNKKGTYCCVSMATMVAWTRHNVTFYVYCRSFLKVILLSRVGN
jgi:hypothetical protein